MPAAPSSFPSSSYSLPPAEAPGAASGEGDATAPEATPRWMGALLEMGRWRLGSTVIDRRYSEQVGHSAIGAAASLPVGTGAVPAMCLERQSNIGC
jgi:hypothetical protein